MKFRIRPRSNGAGDTTINTTGFDRAGRHNGVTRAGFVAGGRHHDNTDNTDNTAGHRPGRKTMRLTLHISPCPNDTFMFEAIVNRRIDTRGIDFDVSFADIEQLNARAMAGGSGSSNTPGGPDICKISYAALPAVYDRYALLDSGSALGHGNGPLLVCRRDARIIVPTQTPTPIPTPTPTPTVTSIASVAPVGLETPATPAVPAIPDIAAVGHEALEACLSTAALAPHAGQITPVISDPRAFPLPAALSVAIPGIHTTANLLLRRLYPELTDRRPVLFSEIAPAVARGEFDAGVLIHEGRFTYRDHGLRLVADLGAEWERATASSEFPSPQTERDAQRGGGDSHGLIPDSRYGGDKAPGKTALPLPLGAIVASRALPPEIRGEVEALIRRSIEYAFAHPQASREFVKSHAREMDDGVIESHISLFVNGNSLTLDPRARLAIRILTGVTV